MGKHLKEKPKKSANGRHLVQDQVQGKKKYGCLARVSIGVFLALAILLLLAFAAFQYVYSRLNIETVWESETTAGIEESETTVGTKASETTVGAKESSQRHSYLIENENRDHTAAEVKNILLIGVDNDNTAGMNDRGNADGLIIVSINEDTKQIVLSSLMRDIYVETPAGKKTKLTLSYHDGGTQTLIDTIEASFGVPIHGYVLLNYLNVIDIVDAMGGLTLNVEKDELYWMEEKIRNLNQLTGQELNANIINQSQAGELTLNGTQIAAYMRIRYAGDGDFDRTARAREVLMGLSEKAKTMGITDLVKLANKMLPMITTDLSRTQIGEIVLEAPQYLGYDMISNRIPIDDSWRLSEQGGSVLIVDFDVNGDFLYQSIYEGKS